MSRNQQFHSTSHEPFKAQRSLELQRNNTTGPVSFLNPTRAWFTIVPFKAHSFIHSSRATEAIARPNQGKYIGIEDQQLASGVQFKWRSRDNRKGRHTLVVDPSSDVYLKSSIPQKTSTAKTVLEGIARMFSQFPYWDVSWLVATIFTLGSIVWVINAFFAFLPLVKPTSEFNNEALVAGGVSAFIGATIFEIGSVLLMVEVCIPWRKATTPRRVSAIHFIARSTWLRYSVI